MAPEKLKRVRNGKRGRQPIDFTQSLAERIIELAGQGKTDPEIAKAINTSPSTIARWKKNIGDLGQSMKRAKDIPDNHVEECLYKLATGYSHEETKVFYDKQAKRMVMQIVTKHYPPSAQAIELWLRNRRPDKWRNRQEITGADGAPLTGSPAQIIVQLPAKEVEKEEEE